MSKMTRIAAPLFMTLFITACGGGGDGSGIKEASNHPPTAITQSVSVKENSTNNAITLTGSDIDGDSLSYAVVEQSSHGSLKGTPPNLSYTPDKGYIGNDEITFKANDGLDDSKIAAISVIITTLLTDEPQFVSAGGDQSVTLGSIVTLTSTNTDPSRTITAWSWKENGITLSTQQSFSKSDFSVGVHTITLTVTDSNGEFSSDKVVVTIGQASGDITVNTKADAAKFLNRTSFGPTEESINELMSKGTYQNWLDEQYSAPTTYHKPLVETLGLKMCSNINNEEETVIDSWEYVFPRHQVWWETAIGSQDQLRQRVAFALSEILVISESEGLGLSDVQFAITSYYDVLVKHAFGNYRDLLEEVTLHPAMGDFLSMTRNQKENKEEGIRPDENYAREILQLFSIGVHELNIDGTVKKNANNQAIPTYDQKKIEEFAKVFTGWSYADKDWYEGSWEADRTKPLIAFEQYHDTSAKHLLNNEVSSAGQTTKQDLTFALDNIFKHPNVAPFVSKRLIQRLVTSNPSPAYIGRVANVFNDNGNGMKGDLKAVVNAILLDNEALAPSNPESFGKLREPLLRMSHLWRAFDMQTSLKNGHYWDPERTCGQGNYRYFLFWNSITNFGRSTAQNPVGAKSVFNFFRPDFTPNGVLNDQGLVAPEFQIMNENTLTSNTNLLHYMVTVFSDSKISPPILEEHSKLDLSEETDLAKDTDKLLDHLSLVLLNNQMSASLRAILKEHLELEDAYQYADNEQLEKAREAILLIISSPEYLIQR